MCRPDGMVFDDGVTSRLADDRFHMTTTTGNAAAVLDHLEEWLQTEWPDLRVRCTSVTEQWSTVAVVGPRARDVVAAARPGPRRRQRGLPVHDLARRGHRGRARSGVPHLVLRGARLRAQRPDAPRRGASGTRSWPPARRSRHHALRHRGDARPARREGLPDHRPGDGRHGHPAGPRAWPPCARPGRPGSASARIAARTRCARTASSSSACCRSTRGAPARGRPARRAATRTCWPPPVPMLGHVTSSYRSAALGRTVRPGPGQGRPRARSASACWRRSWTARSSRSRSPASKLFDPDDTRRDGDPPMTGGAHERGRIRRMAPLPQVDVRFDPADAGARGPPARRP